MVLASYRMLYHNYMNILTWVIAFCILYAPSVFTFLIRKFLLKQKTKLKLRPNLIQIVAAALYPIARYLPEPEITTESVTLLQHFVGGGFVSALYFIFFLREFKIKLPIIARLALLYAFVSTLGVTNELLEFTASQAGIYALDGGDVWWDLAANTSGAYLLFISFELYECIKRRVKER